MSPRLRRADCSGPGIRRRRRGRGFSYEDDEGRRVDEPEVLARIAELAIPPAWQDVWICPYPQRAPAGDGHRRRGAQAVPLPRRLAYAPRQREVRGHGPLRPCAAEAAPPRRARPGRLHGARTGPCVLAAAVRLLERGFFRIGSEEYAAENESYGLATLRKEHVVVEPDGLMVFDFPAKSGQRRHQGVEDERVSAIVAALKRRRGGGDELLAYKERPALARPALRRHQRVPQGGDRRRLLRQGLPHLERDRARRRRAGGLLRGGGDEDGAQARGPARDRGGGAATWATRPRSAAPPTSTRACSTPTRPASRSARRSSASPRRCGRASCRSTSRSWRRPCSTSSPSGKTSAAVEQVAA